MELKILEPAMGAAAFHNEVINQLSELYLEYRQREPSERINPAIFREERQTGEGRHRRQQRLRRRPQRHGHRAG